MDADIDPAPALDTPIVNTIWRQLAGECQPEEAAIDAGVAGSDQPRRHITSLLDAYMKILPRLLVLLSSSAPRG
jgi:hypothetical protein